MVLPEVFDRKTPFKKKKSHWENSYVKKEHVDLVYWLFNAIFFVFCVSHRFCTQLKNIKQKVFRFGENVVPQKIWSRSALKKYVIFAINIKIPNFERRKRYTLNRRFPIEQEYFFNCVVLLVDSFHWHVRIFLVFGSSIIHTIIVRKKTCVVNVWCLHTNYTL